MRDLVGREVTVKLRNGSDVEGRIRDFGHEEIMLSSAGPVSAKTISLSDIEDITAYQEGHAARVFAGVFLGGALGAGIGAAIGSASGSPGSGGMQIDLRETTTPLGGILGALLGGAVGGLIGSESAIDTYRFSTPAPESFLLRQVIPYAGSPRLPLTHRRHGR